MSSKTKIAVATLGVVLVLAVIGLTIGLVLVASQGVVTNSMSVSYTASNVACTITADAYHYDRNNTKGAAVAITEGAEGVTFTADQTTATGAIKFANAEITDSGFGYVVYTFTITNNPTADKAIKAVAGATTAATNMIVDVDDSGAANIAANGGSGKITVTVKVDDKNKDASWTETQLSITVTQVATGA